MNVLSINLIEFNPPSAPVVWGYFSWEHIIPLLLCLGITLSLYILPRYYALLSRTNYFVYSLVGVQIALMIFLRVMQIINIPTFQEAGQNWTAVFPFDFCALTQIFSIIMVFWKNNKFFSITLLFPMFGSWLAILLPSQDVRVEHMYALRFWEYFFAHFVSFFLYFYTYLYGKREYDKKYWKISGLSLLIYSLLMYVVNTSFGTSYIFMGPNQSAGPIDFRNFLPESLHGLAIFLNTMFVMVVMGLGGLTVSYWLVQGLKPIYANSGNDKLKDTWVKIMVNKIRAIKINNKQA